MTIGAILFRKIGTLIRTFQDDGVSGMLQLMMWKFFRSFGDFFLQRRRSRQLSAIFTEYSAECPVWIIVSTVDFAFPYRQRPQHLALAIARSGCLCIYVSPRFRHDAFSVYKRESSNLILVDSFERAMLSKGERNILCMSTDDTLTWDTVQKFNRVGNVVYDYIDDIDPAISRREIPIEHLQAHKQILQDEHITVVASAKRLHDEVLSLRTRKHALITNGVAVEDFLGSRSRTSLRSDFAKLLDEGKPIIGYYGAMASWLDYALIRAVANECPEWNFVFIGPDYDSSASAHFSGSQNLFWLPPMPYADIPRHALWFDVALIPFCINEITLATSPLKLFEYLAMGLPVVSTPLPECEALQVVSIAADVPATVVAIERCLCQKAEPEFVNRLREAGKLHSWDSKVAQLLEI